MEHKELIKFLRMEEYLDIIEKAVSSNGKGMTIMNANKSHKEYMNLGDDPLLAMKTRIKYTYAEKYVVGYARTELDKTFREGLT